MLIGIPDRTISFCGRELRRTIHFIEWKKNSNGRPYKVAICSDCGKEKNIAW